MNVILFDDPAVRAKLLPFTYTRPTSSIRVGILTIKEKWEIALGAPGSFLTEEYLGSKFNLKIDKENCLIQGSVCPDAELVSAISALNIDEYLFYNNQLIACKVLEENIQHVFEDDLSKKKVIEYEKEVTIINTVWKIFTLNASQIKYDYTLITRGRKSEKINDEATVVYNEKDVFIEPGARIKAAIINAENGPIYIGKDSMVSEGSIINGSFALCEKAHLNMGSKMKGDTTIGPGCKVGGEISNSVIFGYSNKAHDGFMGNSVIGEWCNIGADSNTSNLKNNYTNVKIWDYQVNGFKDSGQIFCGLFMGDHSKCGINTMFNTGTTIGVAANIFGSGFPRTFIPSFSWGGANGFTTYQLDKVFETEEKMMARREINLSDDHKSVLKKIFEDTAKNRIWEK